MTRRITIRHGDELPERSFEIGGDLEALVLAGESDGQDFATFAGEVRSDLRELETHYRIEDGRRAGELRRMRALLAALSRGTSRTPRELEGVRALPLELRSESVFVEAALTRGAGERLADALLRVIADFGDEAASREGLRTAFAALDLSSSAIHVARIRHRLVPASGRTGTLSRAAAHELIRMRFDLTLVLPEKEALLDVLRPRVGAALHGKPGFWERRALPPLEPGQRGSADNPVLVCVWDTGVDPALFPDRLHEHGLAYDRQWRRIDGPYARLDESPARVRALESDLEGLFDTLAGLDSPAARAFRTRREGLGPDELNEHRESLGSYNLHAHGTAVADVALAGLRAARLFVVRHTGDPRTVPDPPTLEDALEFGRATREIGTALREHRVRVVNMSWGIPLRAIELDLEAGGVASDATERRALARRIFGVMRDALWALLTSTPDVLYVTGAGNQGTDAGFDADVPASFQLPNLMVVGALDESGLPASFTGRGETVSVYARGRGVPTRLPGGRPVRLSGTSLATPTVTGLAARLLATEPNLTPSRVRELVLAGSDLVPGGEGLRRLHPRRTLGLLESI